MKQGIVIRNRYTFVARDRFGRVMWTETVDNLVTTEGLNDLLTEYFKGSAYTAAWFVGLINNANFGSLQASDTAAKITTTAPTGGTNQWEEATAYSEATRQALTLGTASGGSIDNSASPAVFSINATVTINGAFVVSNNTKGGTSGKLYGEASFSAPRPFNNGDSLSVTVTLTAASA